MDESWRIPIGSMVPTFRSTEQSGRNRSGAVNSDSETLGPDNFRDVFGGPPHTILLRRFSGELSAGEILPASFYDEVFRPTEYKSPARIDRRLPDFSIPAARGGLFRTEEGFYDDIFGSDGGDRRSSSRTKLKSQSRSKSKSNSSSVLSSEDLNPHRPSISEEAVASSFASMLRPITIPSRPHDSSLPSTLSGGEQSNHRNSTIPCPPPHNFMDSHFTIDTKQSIDTGFPRHFSTHRSLKRPGPVGTRARPSENRQQVGKQLEKVVLEVEEEEEEAVENSFVIEIDNHGVGETEGSAAVDDAIAWAKEKSRNLSSKDFKAGHEHKSKENP